ncbi:hypothetical protein X743_18640 [Mesorhizobium sp. LNHC252B00]|nr:hypothetical protein X743_18640 [Mesorhizobium sp. LNHC252B00]
MELDWSEVPCFFRALWQFGAIDRRGISAFDGEGFGNRVVFPVSGFYLALVGV